MARSELRLVVVGVFAGVLASFLVVPTAARAASGQVTPILPMYVNPLGFWIEPTSVNNAGRSVSNFRTSGLDWVAVFGNGPSVSGIDPFPLVISTGRPTASTTAARSSGSAPAGGRTSIRE